MGSKFVPPGVDFVPPGGTIFDPLCFLGLQSKGPGLAAELTVHDCSYRLLNVQLFVLAPGGTLVVQGFSECELQRL